jgi:hypothetical protein
MKPITPKEAKASKHSSIPDEIIQATNELIVEHLELDGSATVLQKDITSRALSKFKKANSESKITSQMMFDKKWMDIEPVFRAAGWRVTYDKPGFNEEYEASFCFERK